MDYRRRQQRAERLLLAFWIGMMLLVVGAGYMAVQYLRPDAPQAAVEATGTLSATAPVAESAPQAAVQAEAPPAPVDAAVPTPAPAAAGLPADRPTPIFTPLPTEAPSAGGMTDYTVQDGDTIYSIASQFGVDFTTILQLNPEVTPEFLAVGDELVVPAGFASAPTATLAAPADTAFIEYQVADGDFLAVIATRFGVTVEAIVLASGLASADQLQVGQILRIPVAPGTATSAAALVTPTASLTPTP